MREFKPDLEIEVTLWRRGGSSGTLTVGFGINRETGQLLYYLGNVKSGSEPGWWLIAERHVFMLDFFLAHKVFFDGQLARSGIIVQSRDGEEVVEIHFEPSQYERFCGLLKERINVEPGQVLDRIPSKKMYALVELLALMIDQMDLDNQLGSEEFDHQWDYFADLLEGAHD